MRNFGAAPLITPSQAPALAPDPAATEEWATADEYAGGDPIPPAREVTMPSPVLDDPDFAPAGSDVLKEILPAIRAELADGERLAWLGRPRRPGLAFAFPATALLVVGTIAGAVGLVILLAELGRRPEGKAAASAEVTTTLLGLAAVFLAGAWAWSKFGPRDRRVAYALTDHRVILREPFPLGQVRVRSFRAQDLVRISRIERADGSGMILLEGSGRGPNGTQEPVQLACLVGLDRAREVEALIRSTLMAD